MENKVSETPTVLEIESESWQLLFRPVQKPGLLVRGL